MRHQSVTRRNSLRHWLAGGLLAWVLLPATVAFAYTGSAQISPQIAAAHVQMALNELVEVESAAHAGRGNAETLSLNMSSARQHLADAADHLGLARMATNDPHETRLLDEALWDLYDWRDRLETQQLSLDAAMRRLRGKVLALHATFRRQVTLHESRQ